MMFSEQQRREIKRAQESWEEAVVASELKRTPETKSEFKSASGIPVKRVYTPLDLAEMGWDYLRDVGFPGQYPFTDSVSSLGYRTGPWVFSQYTGFASAEETNKRLKRHLAQGARELVIAIDLPTQLGYDSDNPLAAGEVGRVGIPICSLADMESLWNGLPIEEFSSNTTANAIGPIYFSMLLAAAENSGVSLEKRKQMRIVVQNDVLKEYVARGTHIFPPKYGLKLSCDLVEYAVRNKFENTIPIYYCMYHIGEAGANSFQQVGFLLANAVEYIRELVRRGINVDDLPQLRCNSFMNMDIFECVAKHRALRRLFARTMKEHFGATNPRVMTATLYSGVEASQYTAQQPLNNLVRGAIGTLASALSGVTVLGLAAFDEARSIPTAESHTLALRTQQIVAHETGVMNTTDPLAGSYYVESLTSQIEEKAKEEFDKIQSMGGAIAAIESGYMKQEVMRSAYEKQKQIESGERVIVGVNKFQSDEPVAYEVMKVDPKEEARQIGRLNRLRRERDNDRVKRTLKELEEATKEGVNLVEPMFASVKAYATIGEICDILRAQFGEYVEGARSIHNSRPC